MNITRALRSFWRPHPNLLWYRMYRIFDTDPMICKDRADLTDKPYLKGVIDRMEAIYEPVEANEWGSEAFDGQGEEASI